MVKHKGILLAGLINLLLIVSTSYFDALEKTWGLHNLSTLKGLLITPQSIPDIINIEINNATFLNSPEINACLQSHHGAIDIRCFSRRLHAELIKKLHDQGADLIVFNLFFREKRGAEDDYFAEAIRTAGNVLLQDYQERRFIGSDLEIVDVTPPISPLAESAASAPLPLPEDSSLSPRLWMFLDLMHSEQDSVQSYSQPILPVVAIHLLALQQYTAQLDSALRPVSAEFAAIFASSPRHYNQRDGVYSIISTLSNLFTSAPHLPMQLAGILEKRSDIDFTAKRYLLALLRIYQRDNDFNLNPYGAEHAIKTIQYHRVDKAILDDPQLFRHKIVFVGPSVEWGRSVKGGVINTAFGAISSTEFSATAFANLRDDNALAIVTSEVALAIALFWWFVVLALQIKLSNRQAAISLGACSSLYMLGGFLLFVFGSILVPWVVVVSQALVGILTSVVARYLLQRQKLHNIIKLSLPPQLTSIFTQQDFETIKQGSNQLGVCMAADGEGYTKLGASKGEQWLANFMLAFQPVVDRCVRKHQGAIKDWAGDGMVALWIERPDRHPQPREYNWFKRRPPLLSDIRKQALHAALALQTDIASFNQTRNVHFPLRIGISYGAMWLSFVDELKAFGDTINVASRVEALNKELQTRILVTEDMLADQEEFVVRRVGNFQLRGQKQAIPLFELMGLKHSIHPELEELIQQFELALRSHEQGLTAQSQAMFSDILKNYPNDGPSQYYYQKRAATLND